MNNLSWQLYMAEFNRIEKEKEKREGGDVCVFCVFDVLLRANWAESHSPWICWFVFEEAAQNFRRLDLQLLFLTFLFFYTHNP